MQEKCYQYWPDQGCWTYGSVRVCVEDCVVLVDYTVRKFCIQAVSAVGTGFWKAAPGERSPHAEVCPPPPWRPAALAGGD